MRGEFSRGELMTVNFPDTKDSEYRMTDRVSVFHICALAHTSPEYFFTKLNHFSHFIKIIVNKSDIYQLESTSIQS